MSARGSPNTYRFLQIYEPPIRFIFLIAVWIVVESVDSLVDGF